MSELNHRGIRTSVAHASDSAAGWGVAGDVDGLATTDSADRVIELQTEGGEKVGRGNGCSAVELTAGIGLEVPAVLSLRNWTGACQIERGGMGRRKQQTQDNGAVLR